jgi:hypothetical protein
MEIRTLIILDSAHSAIQALKIVLLLMDHSKKEEMEDQYQFQKMLVKLNYQVNKSINKDF